MKCFDDETESGREFIFQAANVNHTTNTMLKIKSKLFAWVLTVGSLAITAAGAHAQNANYAPGDLVMFFQQSTGGSQTVYANLGSATTWRGAATGADVANSLNFLNINTELTSAFGASWATDTTLFAGIAGVYSTSTSTSALNSGDPTRTLYISQSRGSAGTLGSADSTGYTILGNSQMTTIAGGITAMNNVLETTYSTAVAVSPLATSAIDNQNGFLNATTQNTAFGGVSGGVQQIGSASSFGAFGSVSGAEFVLDLYRIQPYNNISGQVGQTETARLGTYEGSFALDSAGDISFISSAAVPEPSTYAMCGIAVVAAGIFAYRRRKLPNTVQK